MMLQMKLAGSTIKACDDLMKRWFGDRDTGWSRSYIVSRALVDLYPKRTGIEWEEISNYGNVVYERYGGGLQTALDLTQEEIEQLTIMQQEFKTIFGTKKVYKPFVVKMLIYAELFNLNQKATQMVRKKEKLSAHILVKAGTLNVGDHERKGKKENIWNIFTDSFKRNDIMALQEFIPGAKRYWLEKCKYIDGNEYHVVTPVAWTPEDSGYELAVTLLKKDIVKEYEPLSIGENAFSYRYTYGIATLVNGIKIRIFNMYMPQLCNADEERIERTKQFWDSLLAEITALPVGENIILLGDLNVGDSPEYSNQDKFKQLCRLLNVLDENEDYYTWKSKQGVTKRLDYIFISGHMAVNYCAITNRDIAGYEAGATDHVMLEATFVNMSPYKEYCYKSLYEEDFCKVSREV